MGLFKYWSRISPKQAEMINRRRVHGILLKVTPSRDELSLNELAELLKPLCLPKKKSIMEELAFWRTYDLCSFEIVSNERNVNFYIWAEGRNEANRLRNALNARYPNARITEAVEPIFTVNEGDYVSGGVIEPPLMDGFKDAKDFQGDPLNFLCETLSHIKSTCIIQVLFKPMELNWIHREQLKPLREIKKYDLREPRFEATLKFCTVSKYPLTALNSAIMIGDFFKLTARNHITVKPSRALPLMNPVKLLGDVVRKKYPILLGSRFFLKPDALSTLIHLPSEYEGSGILQAYPSFPPPPVEEKPDIMLGDVVYRGEKYGIAGLSEEDVMRSVYVCGGAGTGKSVLLINMALQLLRKGFNVQIIDFHGDLSEDLIRSIEPEDLEKVYLFDPLRFLFSINPFEIPTSLQSYERDVTVEKIIGETTELIKRLFGSQFWGPSSHRLCSDSLRLAYRHTKNLTYVDVYNILEGKGELASTPEVKNFVHEIRKLPAERVDSVTNKLNPFVKNPMLRSMFCQPSSVDFDELMKPSRLVLWRLPKGELSTFNSTLIASSIVTKIWFHIISRDRQKRNPVVLILDEFQNVFSGGLTLIDTMLSEQRKFGLSQILSHQAVSQVPKETLDIVLSNTGVKILFREPSDGSRTLGRNVDPINYEKIVDALINLPDGSALVKKRAGFGEQAVPVFQIETLKPPEEKPNDVEELVNRMKERYQVPVVELPSGVEQEATPDVIDLLKIVHKLEEKKEEATVGRTLDEFRKTTPNMKGSTLSSICDVAQSSGLIERNVVRQERGRPKIVISITEKGRQKIGIGVEMGGRKGGGDLHRTVILKLAEKLRSEGYHIETPRQAGIEKQHDLLARKSESGSWTQETAYEVETNPSKHPEQVRKNMMKALESGREIVFVVLNDGAKKSLQTVLGEAAKDVKIIVFNPDGDNKTQSSQPQ